MEKNNTSVHSYFWQTSDFLAALAITIGFAVEMQQPTTLDLPFNMPIGILLWFFGLMIILATKSQFKKHAQKSSPGHAPDMLITEGVFKYSRNPIYVGMVVIVVGFGVLFDSWWLVGSSLLAAVLMHFILIKPEEKFLEETFKEEFSNYKKKVRRWV